MKNEECWYCHSQKFSPRYQYEDCAIYRCKTCDFMWLYPRPVLEDLKLVYDQNYFANQNFFENKNEYLYGYNDYLAERFNKQYSYSNLVKEFKNKFDRTRTGKKEQLKWLDIGCGLGLLLDVAFDNHFEPAGVEFNPSAVEFIKSKYTFEIHQGDLLDVEFPKKYDVISVMDVIEHFVDPITVMKYLRKYINEGGYCVLTTMDSDSITCKLIGKSLEDFRRTKEHLFFFTRKTITKLLNDCGWEVVEIRSVGHTFQLEFLLDRIKLISPLIGKILHALVFPRWLLKANFYINPFTKMMVIAQPKKT
jgi:2-polyprenyl-3-methyl-5-hydroxy-6-metoxy-1,4-benzoquinol methylase